MTSAVQAEQSKGTITLPSYHFSYSREAVFLLTNFCTPKAHVSVSHTPSLSPTPPVTCTYCHPFLSPSCHSHVTCTCCHLPVTCIYCHPPFTLLSLSCHLHLLSSSCHLHLLSSSCHPPVTLMSPAPAVISLSPAPTVIFLSPSCYSPVTCTCCHVPVTCTYFTPLVILLSPS